MLYISVFPSNTLRGHDQNFTDLKIVINQRYTRFSHPTIQKYRCYRMINYELDGISLVFIRYIPHAFISFHMMILSVISTFYLVKHKFNLSHSVNDIDFKAQSPEYPVA